MSELRIYFMIVLYVIFINTNYYNMNILINITYYVITTVKN